VANLYDKENNLVARATVVWNLELRPQVKFSDNNKAD
jgi:hypothetical protein